MVDRQRIKFLAGELLSARKMDRLAAQAWPGTGQTGVSAAGGLVPYALQRLQVNQLDSANRQMTCILPGQTPTAAVFTVDLPEIFTETSRGIETYVYTGLNTRTATAGEVVELQEITPPFVVGEIIMVQYVSEVGQYRFQGDGRMWAKVG